MEPDAPIGCWVEESSAQEGLYLLVRPVAENVFRVEHAFPRSAGVLA